MGVGGRWRGKEGAGHEQSHQSPFYRSVTARHFSSPYSHTEGRCCFVAAVCSKRQDWPSNGTSWRRAHCGKYYKGFFLCGAVHCSQSWHGSLAQVPYLALIACQNSQRRCLSTHYHLRLPSGDRKRRSIRQRRWQTFSFCGAFSGRSLVLLPPSYLLFLLLLPPPEMSDKGHVGQRQTDI